jgi:hypothetical protein
MKKVMTLMLGMSLALGTVAAAFGFQDTTTKKESKKKSGKKKKGTATTDDSTKK